MKKLLALSLALVLALTLAACGNSSGNNNTPASNPANSPSSNLENSPSSNPTEAPDNSGSASDSNLEYDPLYLFTDYIADQYAPFEEAINEYRYANTDDNARDALVNDATACVKFSTIDGEKFSGSPVEKKVNGNVTTWTVSGESSSFGRTYLFENSVKLDKGTNTITGELVKKTSDGTVVSREIIESVLLSDGTVLSAYYSYYISEIDNQTYTSANIFKFNALTSELLAHVGSMQDVKVDFVPPSLVGAKDLDVAGYNTFANLTATYTISGDKVDMTNP